MAIIADMSLSQFMEFAERVEQSRLDAYLEQEEEEQEDDEE